MSSEMHTIIAGRNLPISLFLDISEALYYMAGIAGWQDEPILHCDWLPEQQDGTIFPAWDWLPATRYVPQGNSVLHAK